MSVMSGGAVCALCLLSSNNMSAMLLLLGQNSDRKSHRPKIDKE